MEYKHKSVLYHPQENSDHYQQCAFCEIIGKNIIRGNLSNSGMRKDEYPKKLYETK
jgi:hypothetical protein